MDEAGNEPMHDASVAPSPSGNAIARGLTEQAILADIRYFEAKLARSAPGASSHERAMLRVYQSLLAHRRQVLAAFRDGRPEAWYEYEHAVSG